ncbi:MAG: CidA/LrgA family protein [Burkholderiaceae bacterium]
MAGRYRGRARQRPVPGALVGLLLLLGGLVVWGRVPPALDDVSTPLLRHLMLLLIPSVAAVGLYAGLVVQHAAAFLLVGTVVTALTLGLTACRVAVAHEARRPVDAVLVSGHADGYLVALWLYRHRSGPSPA